MTSNFTVIKKARSSTPMQTDIVCKCSEIIMKSQGGETKIRSKVLVFKSGGAFAVCKSCGTEVKVPVKADLVSNPPLILKT
jgi:ribosomal protein S27E